MQWILNINSINICLNHSIITWILHPNLAVVLVPPLQSGKVFHVVKSRLHKPTNFCVYMYINFTKISITYKYNVLFIENQVTSTNLLPDTSGAASSKETLSQQSLVVSNGKKGLYSFVKADPLAATMEIQDSEEKLITETQHSKWIQHFVWNGAQESGEPRSYCKRVCPVLEESARLRW